MINTYESFSSEIYKLTGIDLNLYKERQMKRRIDSLIAKNGYNNYIDYVNVIKVNKELLEQLLHHITINVSEFFRNYKNWEIMEEDIVPPLLKRTSRPLIWSAACSTGEEPYSLAMLLSKYMPLSSINILATDIDEDILEKAKNGIYSAKSIDNVPKEYFEKFFVKQGEVYKISDDIRRCVTFKKHNLLADTYPQNCDFIVCRNVLIYFTEEAKEDIYKKFGDCLKTDGVLFVGSTEQIIMCNKYKLRPFKTFYYIKEE